MLQQKKISGRCSFVLQRPDYLPPSPALVVEQPDPCKGHDDIIFVACIDNIIISNGASRLGDVCYPAPVGSLDIVTEREERIGAEGHARHLVQPCPLFFGSEHFRLYFKDVRPCIISKYIHVVFADV